LEIFSDSFPFATCVAVRITGVCLVTTTPSVTKNGGIITPTDNEVNKKPMPNTNPRLLTHTVLEATITTNVNQNVLRLSQEFNVKMLK